MKHATALLFLLLSLTSCGFFSLDEEPPPPHYFPPSYDIPSSSWLDAGQLCDGGPCKQFGEPCHSSERCDGNRCVPTVNGDWVCTVKCPDGECPDSTVCSSWRDPWSGVKSDVCLWCVPDCEGKECGSDGCGGTCGPGCGHHQSCSVKQSDSEDGIYCVETPCAVDRCVEGICELDINPLNCYIAQTCISSGAIHPDNPCRKCAPSQEPMAWSQMPDGTSCESDGFCLAGECQPCAPDCTDKSCGDDGCGGSCGSCDDDNPCTVDACLDGSCSHGADIDNTDYSCCTQDAHCGDDDPCTEDLCSLEVPTKWNCRNVTIDNCP